MDFENSGEIIASRMLYILDEEGNKRAVSVFIGKPEPSQGARGYECSYQIIGVGGQETQIATGSDSVQALQSAMVLVGANLDQLNQELGGRLFWNGGPTGDLGFP
jgi:hypothetical protein